MARVALRTEERSRPNCTALSSLIILLLCISVASASSVTSTLVNPSQIEAESDATAKNGSVSQDALSPFNPFEHGRFPSYGTGSFDETCGWASPAAPDAALPPKQECSLLVRPRPSTSEGIGEWVSEVVSGFILAVQTGCRLVVDYGSDVDIGRVVIPISEDERNWTVPEGLVCDQKSRCHHVSGLSNGDRVMETMGRRLGVRPHKDDPVLIAVPYYRFAYSSVVFEKLRAVLPAGFHPREGFACGFGSLFRLAPTAAEFVPHLFRDIFPAVQDPAALVIAIYLRTGRTDDMASAEKRGEDSKAMEQSDETRLSRVVDKGIVDCALKVEEERLLSQSSADDTCSDSSDGICRRHDRVVWTVISDSPNVGRIIAKTHSRNNVDPSATPDGVGAIPRQVVTTSTRGVHSRQQRGPSTGDFAEAFIDWWLLGDSDAVVIGGSYTFGRTGALRTSRPLYAVSSKGKCNRKEWV